jgi:hypothetical protein
LAVKKKAPKKKLTKKSVPKKKAANKKIISKKKKAAVGKNSVALKKVIAPKREPREQDENPYPVAFPRKTAGISGAQSGDLQGLSDVEGADSESVDELLEEGNAFEADAVKGVEDADDADEREVHTHEVSEDDVPEEYRENEDE